MHRRCSSSFFSSSALRELDGSRVRKRTHLGDLMAESGSVPIEHEGASCPPLAVSFCKSARNAHLLAVSDEEGYVSLCDTRKRAGPVDPSAGEYRVRDWVAHDNAIFDVCWMKEGALILTGSGDQTIKIWDVESKACTGTMAGHKGSVKSLCCHQSNQDLLVSGSRDGSFALWDLRCKPLSIRSYRGSHYCSIATVTDTHHRMSPEKRTRRGKVASTSITSVLYLKDDISIASATDADSVVKFWDSRCLKSSVMQTSPSKLSAKGEKASHGISSLSQDTSGTFLAASCMDNMIYMYSMLHLENGPVKSFSGGVIGSFYVKASISPDATHILSGSSDKNVHIWQVDGPDDNPVRLKGHAGEVTAVDWCLLDTGKIATSSDDYMVRIWDMKYANPPCSRSPITNRKRVSLSPGNELRDFMDRLSPSPQKINDSGVRKQLYTSPKSSPHARALQPSTPESVKKQKSSCLRPDETIEVQKTPEPTINSPSSVLNPPPSSRRRTIKDYFLVSS